MSGVVFSVLTVAALLAVTSNHGALAKPSPAVAAFLQGILHEYTNEKEFETYAAELQEHNEQLEALSNDDDSLSSVQGNNCDCCYSHGGCTICKPPPKNKACACSYKGFWSCGGSVTSCVDSNSPYCKNPDKSAGTCVQGRGDCGGYQWACVCDDYYCTQNKNYHADGTRCECKSNWIGGCTSNLVHP